MMFFNRQSNKESELKIAKISGVVELNANVYADKLAEAISIVREDLILKLMYGRKVLQIAERRESI